VGTAHRSVQSWLSISSIKEIKEEEKKAEVPLQNLCIIYDKGGACACGHVLCGKYN